MFSTEKVNTGRQIEIDLAKCLSILSMILLHCLMVSTGFKNTISIFMQRLIGQLLGGPFSAPVFMFSIGLGIVYSRNQSPDYLVKRGIKEMLLGLVVNIGEFILPHFLAGYLLGAWDVFPIAGGLLLFCVDILAFAGMAMILIGLFKKINMSSVQMLLVAFVMSVAGSFIRFTDFGNNILNLIGGYFMGTAGGFTAFPLLNWFLFPVTGIFFGEYYIRCSNKKKLLCAWPLCLIISVAYFVASWFIQGGFLSEIHYYYFLTTFDVFSCLICIYGVIGLCYSVSGYLPEGVIKFCTKTSRDLSVIYIVQWFLIPLTYIFICFFFRNVVFGDLSLVIIALIEFVAAKSIADGYKNVKNRFNRKEG